MSQQTKTKTASDELEEICFGVRQLEHRLEALRGLVLDAANEYSQKSQSRTPGREEAQSRWRGRGLKTRPELVLRVQSTLGLATKKEAEFVINAVVAALESTVIENINQDGFSLKLGSFGKFLVRHKPGSLRKIPFTGETKMTNPKRKLRFVALGHLRQLETIG